MAAGGGSKRRYQYCSDNSGTILYLRALQGHSGRNLIDPLLQDNVIIQRGLFHHIYHIGCAFNLHVNTIHPEPEIHEHFMIQKATEHCAQPQAHSHLH